MTDKDTRFQKSVKAYNEVVESFAPSPMSVEDLKNRLAGADATFRARVGLGGHRSIRRRAGMEIALSAAIDFLRGQLGTDKSLSAMQTRQLTQPLEELLEALSRLDYAITDDAFVPRQGGGDAFHTNLEVEFRQAVGLAARLRIMATPHDRQGALQEVADRLMDAGFRKELTSRSSIITADTVEYWMKTIPAKTNVEQLVKGDDVPPAPIVEFALAKQSEMPPSEALALSNEKLSEMPLIFGSLRIAAPKR